MTVQNLDDLGIADPAAGPERATSSRAELTRVLELIGNLPERCRAVFEMRKVYGLSQAETAKALSLSENVVEKETAKGLTLILRTLSGGVLANEASKKSAAHSRISSPKIPQLKVSHAAD